MCFSGKDRRNFRLSSPPPPNGAENGFFHLVSPAGHFRYPPTPFLGVLNSIMSLIPINQALGHHKTRFSGSRPTEFPFIHPPPPKRCRKWVFSPREPGRALQVPTHPFFGGAEFNYEPNSHQPSAGTSQNAFFQGPDRQNLRLSTPPPPKRCRKWVFSPREPGRALQVPTHPFFGGAEFNYEPNSHQPSAGTSQNAFFGVQTHRISVYPAPPPPQRCRKWVFSPREPGRATSGTHPPYFGGAEFNYEPNSQQPSAGTPENVFFR